MRRLARLLLLFALLLSRPRPPCRNERSCRPCRRLGQAYGAQGNGINMVNMCRRGRASILVGDDQCRGLPRPRQPAQTLQQQVTDGFKVSARRCMSTASAAAPPAGLPAGRWITYCGKVKQTGKGEITYFQAISGKGEFLSRPARSGVAPFDPSSRPSIARRWRPGEILRPGGGLRQQRPDPALPMRARLPVCMKRYSGTTSGSPFDVYPEKKNRGLLGLNARSSPAWPPLIR